MKHKKHRYTERDKWVSNVWFRKLSNEDKLFWILVNDMCDDVGVWEVDLEQVNYYLKGKYDLDKLKETFLDQIYEFENGLKWWLIDFISFQYKELHEYSKEELEKNSNLKHSPRPKYVEMLKDYGLWNLYKNGIMDHSTTTSVGHKWDKEEYKEEVVEVDKDEEFEVDKKKVKEIIKTESTDAPDILLEDIRREGSTVKIEVPRINNALKGEM